MHDRSGWSMVIIAQLRLHFISLRYHAAYVATETPAMPGSVPFSRALPGTKRSDPCCSRYIPRASQYARAAALPSTTGSDWSARDPGTKKDRRQIAAV